MIDNDLLLKKVEPIIREAGEILLSYYNGSHTLYGKSDGSFATQADLDAERYLINKLKDIVPGAGFFAEESGIVEGNEYSWVIDPLDGTTNFSQGLPYFCSSVALTKNNKPIFGVIYQPLLKEFFYAFKGGGAFLNGKKLKISSKKKPKDAVVVFALTYIKDEKYISIMSKVKSIVYTTRKFGSAALDQAYCAAGKADLVMFQNLSWWDVAAGMLLLSEAGGVVSDFQGNEIGPEYKTYLSSNQELHEEIMDLLA